MEELDGHTAELEKLTADIHQLVEYTVALDDKEKTKVIKNAKEKVDMIMRDKLMDLVSEFQLRFLERKAQRPARCDVQLENRVRSEVARGHRHHCPGTERDDRGAGGDGEAGA